MSDKDTARRTDLKVIFEGVDISVDIRPCLNSLTYTDNQEDKADDLQIAVDDRENIWLGSWLNTPAQPETSGASATSGTGWNIGDEVTVTGTPQYSSYGNGKPGTAVTNHKGKITNLNLKSGVPYPIHVDQKGWFAENQVSKGEAFVSKDTGSGGAKGATMQAVIVQENWTGDGKDKVLDCGLFEVDSIDVSGPPQKVTLKGTSIPYTSTARTQKKTKAWEKIKLSGIANEIAAANGLKCMFESAYDPLYTRKEQVQESDIVFLKRLCKDAGISLKVTAKIIVLFDEAAYEQKAAVRTIKKGSTDVLSYSFSTNLNDTSYSKCHVSYTDPATGKVIEYTYTPESSDKSGQVLEINEKVSSKEEARQLAMKRLREKNKGEYKANFTLVGDVLMVAGVTVTLSGYGFFDGKYIVEQAVHTVSGGYTVAITLHKVLEGY
jgi:phage protein D